MPLAPLQVDPDVYRAVADAFLRANDAVCDVVAAAATAAGSGGGMAGVDSSGAAWATVYDVAARRALAAGATLADRLGQLGTALAVTGDNHAAAESASTEGAPAYPGQGTGRSAVSVIPATPPSAVGGAGGEPFGWSLVAHLVSGVWPGGHQDRLRAVAAGWSTAAAALDLEADALSGTIGDLSALRSPEVEAAVATCTDVQLAVRSLSAAFAQLAGSCGSYAAELDRAHAEITQALSGVEIARAVADVIADAFSDIVSAITETLARLDHLVSGLVADLQSVVDAIEGAIKHLSALLPTVTVQVSGSGTPATGAAVSGLPQVDLRADERAGGHTIANHVGKSDAYLESRNIKVASTFDDLASAQDATARNLAAKAADVNTWLNGTDEIGVFESTIPGVAGRSYVRSSQSYVQPSGVITVLQRNPAGGYFILTSYPVP